MTLRNLLDDRMEARGMNFTDLARQLGVTRQCVHITLNKNLDNCTVKTVRLYAKAAGLRFNPTAN